MAAETRELVRLEAISRALLSLVPDCDVELERARVAHYEAMCATISVVNDAYVANLRSAALVFSATLKTGAALVAAGFMRGEALGDCLIPHPNPRHEVILGAGHLRNEDGSVTELSVAFREDPGSMDLFRQLEPIRQAEAALRSHATRIQNQRERDRQTADQAARATGPRGPTRTADEVAAEHDAHVAAAAARHRKFTPSSHVGY